MRDNSDWLGIAILAVTLVMTAQVFTAMLTWECPAPQTRETTFGLLK